MFRISVCLIALIGALSQAQAADVPVEAFPANSAFVARIADVDKTTSKLKELVSEVAPNQAAQTDILSPMAGTLIDNPAKLGVKKGTDWWFAAIANEDPNTPPALVIAVEAEDVAGVKDAVGEAYTYVEYENWLIYTKDSEAGAAVAACVTDGADNVSKAIDMKAVNMVMSSDTALFINIEQLVKLYKDQIEAGRGQLKTVLDQAAEEVENSPAQVPGMNIGAVMDMYGQMAGYFLDAVYDMDYCIIGMTVSKEGIHFDEYLTVVPDSPTAKFLAKHPASSLSTLNQLPMGALGYFGMHFEMSDFSAWGMEMMQSMFGQELVEGISKEEMVDEMKKLGYGDAVGSFQLGDLQSGLFQMSSINQIKNAKGSKDFNKQMMEMFGSIDSPLLKQSMTYEEGAEELDGKPVDKITIKQELGGDSDDDNPQAAQAKQMQQMAMQMMYGPEGQVTRMMYLDDKILSTTGGTIDLLAALLKSSSDSKTSPAFDRTRDQLGQESNLIIMFDLPSMIAKGVEAAAATGLLPPGALNMDSVEESYLGYSVSLSEGGLEVDAHIPTAQIKGLFDIGMQGFMMYQGLQQR